LGKRKTTRRSAGVRGEELDQREGKDYGILAIIKGSLRWESGVPVRNITAFRRRFSSGKKGRGERGVQAT
jgi:hypothetical protein